MHERFWGGRGWLETSSYFSLDLKLSVCFYTFSACLCVIASNKNSGEEVKRLIIILGLMSRLVIAEKFATKFEFFYFNQ